eukprot:gene10062-20962_t
MIEESVASSIIDALMFFCKSKCGRVLDFSTGQTDEIDKFYTLLKNGEATKDEYDTVPTGGIFWNAVMKLLAATPVFSEIKPGSSVGPLIRSLPNHVQRLLGAVFTTVDLIVEKYPQTTQSVLKTILETLMFHPQPLILLEILKDYKTLFPYSYMFCRRIGFTPKTSVEAWTIAFTPSSSIQPSADTDFSTVITNNSPIKIINIDQDKLISPLILKENKHNIINLKQEKDSDSNIVPNVLFKEENLSENNIIINMNTNSINISNKLQQQDTNFPRTTTPSSPLLTYNSTNNNFPDENPTTTLHRRNISSTSSSSTSPPLAHMGELDIVQVEDFSFELSPDKETKTDVKIKSISQDIRSNNNIKEKDNPLQPLQHKDKNFNIKFNIRSTSTANTTDAMEDFDVEDHDMSNIVVDNTSSRKSNMNNMNNNGNGNGNVDQLVSSSFSSQRVDDNGFTSSYDVEDDSNGTQKDGECEDAEEQIQSTTVALQNTHLNNPRDIGVAAEDINRNRNKLDEHNINISNEINESSSSSSTSNNTSSGTVRKSTFKAIKVIKSKSLVSKEVELEDEDEVKLPSDSYDQDAASSLPPRVPMRRDHVEAEVKDGKKLISHREDNNNMNEFSFDDDDNENNWEETRRSSHDNLIHSQLQSQSQSVCRETREESAMGSDQSQQQQRSGSRQLDIQTQNKSTNRNMNMNMTQSDRRERRNAGNGNGTRTGVLRTKSENVVKTHTLTTEDPIQPLYVPVPGAAVVTVTPSSGGSKTVLGRNFIFDRLPKHYLDRDRNRAPLILTEYSLSRGGVMEAWMDKRAVSTGLWNKRYITLVSKENNSNSNNTTNNDSDSVFELQVFAKAIPSAWGFLPVQ